jgi:hypothetical protein
MFVFKYLTPFLYNLINNILNKKNLPISVKKSRDNNLSSKNKSFNIFYSNLSNKLDNNLIYYFILKKIILQNNNNKKFFLVESFYFILSYTLVNANRFENIKLVYNNNFFNFQQINNLINTKSLKSINQFQNYTTDELNIKKIRNIFNKVSFLPKVKLNNLYKNILIKFNSTSIDRLLNNSQIYNILFIRNFKVFNKGRYSRNRQYYRTGVYWCLYINIVAVVGMYYWFYRFTMNFGYLWWLFYFFILTFFFSKFIKYSSSLNIKNEIYLIIKWLGYIIESLYQVLNHSLLQPVLGLLLKGNLINSFIKNSFYKSNTTLINLYSMFLKLL